MCMIGMSVIMHGHGRIIHFMESPEPHDRRPHHYHQQSIHEGNGSRMGSININKEWENYVRSSWIIHS
jgi:hypothetical protein